LPPAARASASDGIVGTVKVLFGLLLLSGTAHAQVFAVVDHGPPPKPPTLPGPPSWFFSLSSGTGGGVIGGTTEGAEADVATGPQWAPMHLRAELGLIRNERWSAALVGRMGFPLFVDVGDPPTAKAVMVKVYRSMGPWRINVAAGGGYLRYRVGVDNVAHDVMAAGPILFGGGVGYVKELSRSWRFIVDANVTGAIAYDRVYDGARSEHAVHVDVDVGLAVYR
jgi:hypothetical protein